MVFTDDEDDVVEEDADMDTDDLDEADFDEEDSEKEEDENSEEEAMYKSLEKKSKKRERKMALDAGRLEEEMRQDAMDALHEDLESGSEAEPAAMDEREDANLLDVNTLKTRIQNSIMILTNFSKMRDPTVARSQYVRNLQRYLAAYYGYSEFMIEMIYHLFPVSELVEFLEASDVPRPITIRTNTLKTKRRDLAQALINRGVNVDPLDKWSKVGLQVFDSPVPIGATPEYLAGHYMLQAAASFLPVISLDPKEHERVLDMCAAPGGKTTYIAQLMKNTGCLFSNDVNKDRMKATAANIHRMGIKNTVVSLLDGRSFPEVIGGFDRVLVDAPCSGTGVISKDASVKTSKTEQDFKLLSHLQKELILAAIDSIDANSKTGGVLVYSTCSVSVEENEEIVTYALKRRPNVKLVETGLEFGTSGFTAYRGRRYPKELALTKRYYPHTHNLDGFYVAKFVKTSNTIPMSNEEKAEHEGKVKRIQETKRQVKQTRRLKAEMRAARNKLKN